MSDKDIWNMQDMRLIEDLVARHSPSYLLHLLSVGCLSQEWKESEDLKYWLEVGHKIKKLGKEIGQMKKPE